MDDQSWAFHVNGPSWLLQAGDGEQTTFFQENETPAVLIGAQGARGHTCVEFVVIPPGGRWVRITVDLVLAPQTGGFGVVAFSLRTNIWTFLLSLHAVLGRYRWRVAMRKNGTCRYVRHQMSTVLERLQQLACHLRQEEWTGKLCPPPLEEKTPSRGHAQMASCRGWTGLAPCDRTDRFARSGVEVFLGVLIPSSLPSSIPPQPTEPQLGGKGFLLLSFLEP